MLFEFFSLTLQCNRKANDSKADYNTKRNIFFLKKVAKCFVDKNKSVIFAKDLRNKQLNNISIMEKKIIAISGDQKRRKDVIHILESIGGDNSMFLYGNDAQKYYFIADGAICSIEKAYVDSFNFEFHTIDTFLQKYGKDGLMYYELKDSLMNFKQAYRAINSFAEKNNGVIKENTLVSMDTIKHQLEELLNELKPQK